MQAQARHTSTLTEDATSPVLRRLLDVKGAALYLSVSAWTIRQRIGLGQLPVVRIGRRVLLDRSDLDAWVSAIKNREPA